MKAVTLLYHDAVDGEPDDFTGFPGEHAAVYKLDIGEMAEHFEAVAASRKIVTSDVNDYLKGTSNDENPFFLTFDDGGISAATHIAGLLDKFGWKAHFFVTGAYIDTPTFVSSEQIRELHKKGHIIGSHSWSHPALMGKCGYDELVSEWEKSVERLGGILGEAVTTASVPGGYYTDQVARAASECGIRALFTSEPVKNTFFVDKCMVLGRYSIIRNKPPALSAALASDRLSADQTKQYLYWNAKKAAKKFGGNQYLALQKKIFNKEKLE